MATLRKPSSFVSLGLVVAAVALYATGLGPRPDGLGWDRFYDVVLYNEILGELRVLVGERGLCLFDLAVDLKAHLLDDVENLRVHGRLFARERDGLGDVDREVAHALDVVVG